MRFATRIERWPLRKPFVIARDTMHDLPLVHLTIEADGIAGTAEAAGVDYHGETVEGLKSEIDAYLGNRTRLPDRDALLADLPAGGARNAIDCALWDWEARKSGQRVVDTAGVPKRATLLTCFTIGLDTPEAMARDVANAPDRAPLKLKLGGADARDVDRVAAVRAAAPERFLMIDVNEGWTLDQLRDRLPALEWLGVRLIEQPLPAGADEGLASITSPVPIYADESFDDLSDLDRLHGYAGINIKLDKCGGLTAALRIAGAARARGMGLMVGSMVGTSLGMAPGFVIGSLCDMIDLDGPLLLADDRRHAMVYDGAVVHPPARALWG